MAAISGMLSVMDHSITALERAFQLARLGSCSSVKDIKKRLVAEGHSVTKITGKVLSKQLDVLIKAAMSSHAPRS